MLLQSVHGQTEALPKVGTPFSALALGSLISIKPWSSGFTKISWNNHPLWALSSRPTISRTRPPPPPILPDEISKFSSTFRNSSSLAQAACFMLGNSLWAGSSWNNHRRLSPQGRLFKELSPTPHPPFPDEISIFIHFSAILHPGHKRSALCWVTPLEKGVPKITTLGGQLLPQWQDYFACGLGPRQCCDPTPTSATMHWKPLQLWLSNNCVTNGTIL